MRKGLNAMTVVFPVPVGITTMNRVPASACMRFLCIFTNEPACGILNWKPVGRIRVPRASLKNREGSNKS